jgi:hypothetical protein
MSWRERFWGRSVVAWRAMSRPVCGCGAPVSRCSIPEFRGWATREGRIGAAPRAYRAVPLPLSLTTVGVVVGVTDPGVLIGE